MFSSKVIKSEQPTSLAVANYTFSQVGTVTSAGAEGFVPMGLFDPSELLPPGSRPLALDAPAEAPIQGLAITEEELEQRLKDAFNHGLQEGKNLAERGLVNVFRSMRTASESLLSLREKVLRESEEELVNLTVMIAKKVILKEVTHDRSILSNVVQAAIASLSERERITIRLNPDDHALVTTGHEDYLRRELLSDRMHIKPDPVVQPGGCMIDTELGTIDASIDAQLEEIHRRLLEERSSSVSVQE